MGKVVDLSHTLVPGNAGRKLSIEMVSADEVNPNVKRLVDLVEFYEEHR